MTEQERNALVEKSIDFVYSRAKKYKVRSEDVIQDALLALVESSRRFDPSLGFSFLTYAARNVDWTLIKKNMEEQSGIIKKNHHVKDRTPLVSKSLQENASNTATRGGHQKEITLEEILPGEDGTRPEKNIDTELFMKSLEPEQRQIVLMRMQDKRQRDIAKQLGKSQAHVSREVAKIRDYYNNMNAD